MSRAQAFQPHLADLLIRMALPVLAAHALDVIHLLAALPAGLRVLSDSQRHVRLERHQAAVQIRKGQHILAEKEAFIGRVKAVFLKTAHPVSPVAIALIKTPQPERRRLRLPESADFRVHVPVPSDVPFPVFAGPRQAIRRLQRRPRRETIPLFYCAILIAW